MIYEKRTECELVVGNFPVIVMLREFGNEEQKKKYIWGQLEGRESMTFGLTEPGHGSDATFMDTTAKKQVKNGVDGWIIKGR